MEARQVLGRQGVWGGGSSEPGIQQKKVRVQRQQHTPAKMCKPKNGIINVGKWCMCARHAKVAKGETKG